MLKTVKKKSKKETAFSKKWAQVEKKQKRNINFKNKMIKFHQQFEEDILPFEIELCEMMAKETRHLMSFMPRKSFTQWQREELMFWIESNLDTLSEHPFTPDDLAQNVRKEYSNYLTDSVPVLDKDEAMDPANLIEMRNLLAEFEIDDELSDEQLAEFICDPQAFSSFMEKKLAERQESEAEEPFDFEEDDRFFEEMEDDYINSDDFQHFQQSHKKHQKKLKDLFNASLLKKCYKKLASILHPDKEQDPLLKEEKSDLMAILAQAKKEKDAFTIISMYQKHVPNNDLNLDEDVSVELIALIDEKIKRLDDEHHHLKSEPSIENMIWQKLGGRSKKIMAEKKLLHLSDLQQACGELQSNIHNSKNMKQLNKQLSDRYDKRHSNPFSNFGAMSELFSGMDPDDILGDFPFK